MPNAFGKDASLRDLARLVVSFPGAGLWMTLAAVIAADATWLALSSRLSLDLWSSRPIASVMVLTPVLAIYCGSRSDVNLQRLYVPLSGVLFITVAFTALRVLNHLTMSVPFPLADDELARFDGLLGLNWLAYADWVAGQPFVIGAFQLAYSGLTLVALSVFVLLFAVGRVDRAKEFIRLVFWSCLAAIIIGSMFPAKAAMDRFASLKLQAIFGPDAGVYSVPYLNVLRSNVPHVLNLQDLPGLVTMPSFHTACAVLIAYCCRKIRILQTSSILYAFMMIASTPIMGGHYFVDLIGGALLVVAVVLIDRKVGYFGKASSAGLPVSPIGLTTETR